MNKISNHPQEVVKRLKRNFERADDLVSTLGCWPCGLCKYREQCHVQAELLSKLHPDKRAQVGGEVFLLPLPGVLSEESLCQRFDLDDLDPERTIRIAAAHARHMFQVSVR